VRQEERRNAFFLVVRVASCCKFPNERAAIAAIHIAESRVTPCRYPILRQR
jgi:hypothetical protein